MVWMSRARARDAPDNHKEPMIRSQPGARRGWLSTGSMKTQYAERRGREPGLALRLSSLSEAATTW